MHVPLVLTDFLDRAVELYGEKPAIIGDDQTLTYNELHARVQKIAHGLKALQIKKGDKIAYLAPNTYEMLEGFYGVFQVGGIITPLNTRLKAADYIFILNHSESQVLFVDHELFPLIEPIIDQLETVREIIVHGAQEDTEQYKSYEKWLDAQPSTEFDRVQLEETDVASLLYTSGTTGNPKGVMLTHRSNYLHALSTQHHLRVTDQDTLLHVLPMFHVNGWGSPFYYTANGATQVMLRKVDAETIFKKIEKHQVTVAHMAPTVLNLLLTYYQEKALKSKGRHASGHCWICATSRICDKSRRGLGWEFIHVYGMTEISPLITTSQIRSQHRSLPKDRAASS